MQNNIIHTLWTGGLDSTARIVELSRKSLIIQPYYLIDQNRPSTSFELKAMEQIRDRLLSDKKTLASILPVKVINADSVRADETISNAWQRINLEFKVGSQYDFLARYAKDNDIILEIGIERGGGRAQTAIRNQAEMTRFEDITGINFRISENHSETDTFKVFKWFTFPLWEKNKHEEVDLMKKSSCGDVVEMTWFCHNPLLGKPCGHCNPCKDARHYGFGWRLSRSRYFLWYILRPKTALRSILKRQ